MNENDISSDINAPIDDLQRDCVEAVAMIRRKHAESRSKLGLDRPANDGPVEPAIWLARLARMEYLESQRKGS